MIIKDIIIDGFGHFRDAKLSDLKTGVNLVIGKNEAGKSTLLQFIRYTLFGYPSKGYKYEPLNGGNHGGRLLTELANGKEVVFERYAGSKGWKIRLHYDGKDSESNTDWESFLGNAHLELYKNIYGISLYELNEFKEIESTGISDKILSVGMGLGGVSLSEVSKGLMDNTESIYKKGGSAQDIPKILKEIEVKKQAIIDIQQNLPLFESVVAEMEQCSNQSQQIKESLSLKQTEKSRLENYLKCHESYIRILQIDRDLENLPQALECPPESEAAFLKLVDKRETFSKEIQELMYNQDNDGIDQLEERIKAISYNEKIIDKESDINLLRQDFSKYETILTSIQENKKEKDAIEAGIKDVLNKISSNWTKENVESFSGIIEKKGKAAEFQRNIKSVEEEIKSLEVKRLTLAENKSILRYANIHIILAILFFLLAISTYFSNEYFACALFAFALILLFFKKVFFKKKPDLVGDQLQEKTAQKDHHINSYKTFLVQELNLSETVPVDVLPQVFDQIQGFKNDLTKLNALEIKKARELVPFVEKYEEEIKKLRSANLIADVWDSNKDFIEALHRELDKAKEQEKTKTEFQKLLESKRKVLDNKTTKINEISEAIKSILLSANCNDEESFKVKVSEENTIQRLRDEKKSNIEKIELVIGFEKSGELFEYFQDNEKEETERLVQELEKHLQDGQDALRDANTRYGELRKEKENLEIESSLAETATELEIQKTKLAEAYKKWLSGKIALTVFNDVKGRYEKEKQPEVIKYAGSLFSKVTAGSYQRINVSMDDKAVTVVDTSERVKQINQLSRGAKEQLLICLRLGLIEEYEKLKEPLPLVLDDIFVNFDPGRTKAIATIIESFAEKRQVIIFTCHPGLAEKFSDRIKTIKIG